MNLHIFTIAAIVDQLQRGESVSSWFLSSDDWTQMEQMLPLDFKGDYVRLAVPEVLPPNYVSNSRTRNSRIDDWYFEETHKGVQI